MPVTSPSHDLLDRAIAILIMFFILSMISERFVTWVKLYFGKIGRRLWLFSNKNEDITLKKQNPAQEKLREQKILGLTIVLSIIIAFLANANLFKILSSDPPYNAIGWNGFDITKINLYNVWGEIITSIFGYILTGFFISLGSKFWHDLLDLLLYSKNLKQKLSDPQTYEVTSADQLTEYLSFNESDLVRHAIDQNGQTLKTKFPNIQFLSDSIAIVKGERKDVLAIYIKDQNTNGIPEKVPVKLPSGKIYNVNTEIITGAGVAKVSGGMDGSLANIRSQGYRGSACCVAKNSNGDQFVITNCHVLSEGDLNDPLTDTGNHEVYYNNDIIGNWSFGSMDATGDFSLVLLKDGDDFITNNSVEKFSNQFKDVIKDDYLTSVMVRGNLSNKIGYIVDMVSNQIGIQYNYGKTIIFDEAILLGNVPNKQTCGPVTDFGDSGGAVFNDKMELVGIITGVINGRFTVVIPLRKFANIHSLQII